MSLEKNKGIFYTVYDDHVIVGNGTTLQQNAIVPGEKPTTLILQDQVNGIDVTEISQRAFFWLSRSNRDKASIQIKNHKQ